MKKNKMNLPNKLTMLRMFLALIVIIILLVPFDTLGMSLPKIFVNESIVIDIKYIISGILFIIASITDFVDGYIARKYNMVTDFGKMMDAIADKVLVNSILIILSSTGFIHPIISVVVIVRDIVVDSIKMVASSKGKVVAAIKTGKFKTACLMVGITLTLFYNLPFELWNIKISEIFLIIASILSIISAIEYYYMNRKLIFNEE